jgi:hypothetical protein
VFSDVAILGGCGAIPQRQSSVLVDSLEQFIDPLWSPDGALIAGASCVAARCELRVGRADGSLKLIPLPDRYTGARSPDQRWVAYIGGPPNGDRHINIVDVAAGQVQQLSTVRSPTASRISPRILTRSLFQ